MASARKRAPSNVDACAETLAALRLPAEHAALVQAARTLAERVDTIDGADDASLWREYRAVLATLLEVGAGVDDHGEAEFGASVRTPLRDASVA